jgi:predicted phage tail protein
MGQVNGKSTIEEKTMTVTGVAVKKSDTGFDVDEYSVLSAGRGEAREYPTWQWFDRRCWLATGSQKDLNHTAIQVYRCLLFC